MKICMLAYTFYESDDRVKRYAETFTKRGDSVDVIVSRQKNLALFEEVNGVKVYRIQEREINERGKLAYLIRLIRFLIKSAILLGRKHLKESYDLIHVHSVPDFEVFASIIPKFKGAKIILDIHDLVPEFYRNKFNEGKSSILYKCLIFIEKVSIAFSDRVIISRSHFKTY